MHRHLTMLRVRLAAICALVVMAVVPIKQVSSRSGVLATINTLTSIRRVSGSVVSLLIKAEDTIVGTSMSIRLDACSRLLHIA